MRKRVNHFLFYIPCVFRSVIDICLFIWGLKIHKNDSDEYKEKYELTYSKVDLIAGWVFGKEINTSLEQELIYDTYWEGAEDK